MTDWNIATGASQPINRTGIENTQFAASEAQATLVGIVDSDSDGNYELIKADADSAATNQVHAVGAYLHEEVIDLANIPSGNYLQDLEEQLVQENKKLVGDRGTVVFDGIELVNDDGDTSWTPGEPVYLAPGGGFTQTKPTATGDLQQVVGVALTPDKGGDGNDRIYLRIAHTYATA